MDFPEPGQSGRHGGNHHRQCVQFGGQHCDVADPGHLPAGNKARVKRQCAALLTAFAPKRVSDACMRVGQMFIGTFSIFLSRQCLEACILGSILFVGMLIFGLPYAISSRA